MDAAPFLLFMPLLCSRLAVGQPQESIGKPERGLKRLLFLGLHIVANTVFIMSSNETTPRTTHNIAPEQMGLWSGGWAQAAVVLDGRAVLKIGDSSRFRRPARVSDGVVLRNR